jgi:hypothetical protein
MGDKNKQTGNQQNNPGRTDQGSSTQGDQNRQSGDGMNQETRQGQSGQTGQTGRQGSQSGQSGSPDRGSDVNRQSTGVDRDAATGSSLGSQDRGGSQTGSR